MNYCSVNEKIVSLSGSPRIFLSARDAGAAGHIAEIARALQERGAGVHVVAHGPALALLADEGLGVMSVSAWLGCELPAGPVDQAFLPVLSAALHRVGAEAVVVGQSARTEASIDDWLLAASADLPAIVMQDFWGEVQSGHMKDADLFLVLDADAAQVTQAKVSVPVVVVGSPKHARYTRLDWHRLRAASRAAMGVGPDEFVIGHFGQDLQRLPGYRNLVSDIADAAAAQEGARLVYRPHPRENAESIKQTLTLLDRHLNKQILLEGDIESALAGVDVVISCFSTCGYDALYLTRHLNGVGPAVIYVDYDPEVRRYWTQHAGVSPLPPVTAGTAFGAQDRDDLMCILRSIRRPETRAALSEKIHRYVPDPAQAPALAADAVLVAVEHRASERLKWSRNA